MEKAKCFINNRHFNRLMPGLNPLNPLVPKLLAAGLFKDV